MSYLTSLHPKFSHEVDGKATVTTMLVPIARMSGAQESICVMQLRNKYAHARVKEAVTREVGQQVAGR